MRTPRSWRKFLILLLIPASLLVKGCGLFGPSEDDPHGEEVGITATLLNLDHPALGLAVHLLGPDETFPTGRLDPGQSRTYTFLSRVNGQTEFRAGRNGDIIATKSCTCTTAVCGLSDGPRLVRVEWNGSALACVSW